MKRKHCIVLACDRSYFGLARNCINSIGPPSDLGADLKFIAISLDPNQRRWLHDKRIDIFDDTSRIRLPNGLAEYVRAQTCRPHLQALFPGYEVYLWIDSDVKILKREALQLYFQFAKENRDGGVFALECDPSYLFIKNPLNGMANAGKRFERVVKFAPENIAKLMAMSLQYNSGVFAMNRQSRVWEKYRSWINKIVDLQCFTHLSDQDALNVALLEAQVPITNPGACLNWICSAALPRFDSHTRSWTRPVYPFQEILVAHLTQCKHVLDIEKKVTLFEAYRQLGLIEAESPS